MPDYYDETPNHFERTVDMLDGALTVPFDWIDEPLSRSHMSAGLKQWIFRSWATPLLLPAWAALWALIALWFGVLLFAALLIAGGWWAWDKIRGWDMTA